MLSVTPSFTDEKAEVLELSSGILVAIIGTTIRISSTPGFANQTYPIAGLYIVFEEEHWPGAWMVGNFLKIFFPFPLIAPQFSPSGTLSPCTSGRNGPSFLTARAQNTRSADQLV